MAGCRLVCITAGERRMETVVVWGFPRVWEELGGAQVSLQEKL